VLDITRLGSGVDAFAFRDACCKEMHAATMSETVDVLSNQVANRSLAYIVALSADKLPAECKTWQLALGRTFCSAALAGRSTDSQQLCAPLTYLT